MEPIAPPQNSLAASQFVESPSPPNEQVSKSWDGFEPSPFPLPDDLPPLQFSLGLSAPLPRPPSPPISDDSSSQDSSSDAILSVSRESSSTGDTESVASSPPVYQRETRLSKYCHKHKVRHAKHHICFTKQ